MFILWASKLMIYLINYDLIYLSKAFQKSKCAKMTKKARRKSADLKSNRYAKIEYPTINNVDKLRFENRFLILRNFVSLTWTLTLEL